MTNQHSRGELLTDLADAVNELTEPRHHVEYLEATVVETITGRNGRQRQRRTKQRRKHVVTLPGLLDSLQQAMVPGAGESSGGAAGFESRPSAELEPVAVMREIRTDAAMYARALNVNRDNLAGTLHALVGARHTDQQLANLVRDARRWVKRARLATGFDPAPITLNEPCPYCGRRHALVITGDLQAARCARCGTDWDVDTIGLLADMLRANAEQETAVLVACWMPDCTRRGVHDQHQDVRGRTWLDTCDVAAGQ